VNLYENVFAMKLFTDFLLYAAIGLVLYFILYAWRKRLSFAFRAFFIAGPVALGAYYALGIMQAVPCACPLASSPVRPTVCLIHFPANSPMLCLVSDMWPHKV